MSFSIILVLTTLFFVLIILYFDLLGPGFTFLIAVTVLMIFGVITPNEMLSGIANENVADVILLLLVGSIFEETNILTGFLDKIFKNISHPRRFVLRLSAIVAGISAFMNNTPLVSLLIPYVKEWAKKNKAPVTKLLIPLSYAAILGGAATLIGTSTNMIINGMVAEQHMFPNFHPFNIFDFTPIGGTMIIIGTIYLFTIGYNLLPSHPHKAINKDHVITGRIYSIEVQVKENSSAINHTFAEIKEKFKELELYQINRNGQILTKNLENIPLQPNDLLLLGGEPATIDELLSSTEDFRIPSIGMFLKKHKIDLVEIVIADNSWLINRTLRTANFRAKYDATAIAIHRNGEQIQGQLSDIKLKPGDAILILAGEKFWALTQNTKDFYIISKLKEIRKLGFWRSLILVGGTLLVILLSALKIISLFLGLIVLLIVFTSVKITTPQKLGEKIDYDLGFLIVMALAFGKAMIKSNSADLIANFLIDIFKPLGTMGILVGLFIITALIASFITNKAAVAILFPISLTIAKELSIPPQAAVLTMAYASTANFLTPIGYQTNTMVYGAGGYKFRDFFKVGGILTIIYCIVTVTMVKLLYM